MDENPGATKKKKSNSKLINHSNDASNKKKETPEFEEFLHPNAMRESEYDKDRKAQKLSRSQFIKQRKEKLNSIGSCFKRFDDLIMRPFLIYNYEHELLSKKDEFMELFMKEGDLWEKMYLKEEYDQNLIEDGRSQRGHSVFLRIEEASRRNSQFRNVRASGLSTSSKKSHHLTAHQAPSGNSPA